MATKSIATEADVQAPESHPENVTEEVSVLEELEKLVADDGEQPEGEEKADNELENHADEEREEKPDEDQEQEAAHSPHVQKRIDSLVAQRNTVREENETLKERLKSLEEKVGENVGLDPSYLDKDQLKLVAKANELEGRENWLLDHVDGYDHPTDDDKSMTASEVRTELKRVRVELASTTPKANASYAGAKSAMLADIALGKAVRALGFDVDNGKLVMKGARKKSVSNTKKDPPAIQPATSSPGEEISAQSARKGMSEKRFIDSGATMSAAERELAELIPD